MLNFFIKIKMNTTNSTRVKIVLFFILAIALLLGTLCLLIMLVIALSLLRGGEDFDKPNQNFWILVGANLGSIILSFLVLKEALRIQIKREQDSKNSHSK
jgi:hypothetical protein